MKLTKLEPQFIRFTSPGHHSLVGTLNEAQGVKFLCPKCFTKNGGNVGTHSIMVWFRDRGVPEAEVPGPGRWMAICISSSASLH